MKLLRMTATFGKLNNETLELTDGLHILSRANEDGKSTWAAFLLTMFYGLPSNDRRKTDRETKLTVYIPYKEKYEPWSGREMGGSIDLVYNGQEITIERSKKMSKFSARDTRTGAPIDWLTGENCGQLLLGAERSVFERSAFIGQSAAAVTQDAALEQRLQQLVSTGDEQVSYTQTEKKLHELTNKIHSSKNMGVLVDATQELAAVNDALDRIADLSEKTLELRAEETEANAEQARLTYVRDCLEASAAQAARKQRSDAEEAAKRAEETYTALQKQAETLPPKEALHGLLAELTKLRDAANAPAEPAPEAPTVPKGFDGCTAEGAEAFAAQRAAELRALEAPAKTFPLWIFALAAIVLGGVLAAFYLLYGLAVAAVGAAIGTVWLILRGKAARTNEERRVSAQAILETLGAASAEQIISAAARWAADSESYRRQVAASEAAAKQREDARKEAEDAFYKAVRTFAPSIYDYEQAERAINAALETHGALAVAQTEAAGAQARLQNLPEAKQLPPPAEDFTDRCALPDVEAQLAAIREKLSDLREQLAHHDGAKEQYGDLNELTAQREALTARIADLKQKYDAIALAQRVLKEADDEMRAQFAPQLAELAAEKLAVMTDGRYEKVLVQRDFTMLAQAADESTAHEMLLLSGGTLSQLYLALRLAICDLTLPPDTPIVLDDAFAFYDDTRLKNALKLLKQEAETRQILLLTCQTREQALLSEVDG